MKRPYLLCFLFLSFLVGCARLHEGAKAVWGSSTKALEDSRADATVKNYDCSADACFDTLVGIIRRGDQKEAGTKEKVVKQGVVLASPGYEIFLNDRKKRQLIVMGVPGSVDTTEVGIFVSPGATRGSKVEIVSLSPGAQETVSAALLNELGKVFPEITEPSL